MMLLLRMVLLLLLMMVVVMMMMLLVLLVADNVMMRGRRRRRRLIVDAEDVVVIRDEPRRVVVIPENGGHVDGGRVADLGRFLEKRSRPVGVVGIVPIAALLFLGLLFVSLHHGLFTLLGPFLIGLTGHGHGVMLLLLLLLVPLMLPRGGQLLLLLQHLLLLRVIKSKIDEALIIFRTCFSFVFWLISEFTMYENMLSLCSRVGKAM